MKNVADIYPLSPVQQGILFHSLYMSKTGMYVTQMTCIIEGTLDTTAFMRAWQYAVERHPVLRTTVIWKGQDEPLQIVRRQATPRWDQHDWRLLPPGVQ